MINSTCRVATLIALLAMTSATEASVPLIDMDPAAETDQAQNEPNINGTWGWTFYVKSPITVTHVGWYDQDGNGLTNPHRIGLWKDLSGAVESPFVRTTDALQLLKNSDPPNPFTPFMPDGVVVPALMEAELVGPWRRVALPFGPLQLSRGGYVLGGLDNRFSGDVIRYHFHGLGSFLPADPRIEIGLPGRSDQDGFRPPSVFFAVPGGVEFGPMLFVLSVPEPSGHILAATSFLSIILPWKRARLDCASTARTTPA